MLSWERPYYERITNDLEWDGTHLLTTDCEFSLVLAAEYLLPYLVFLFQKPGENRFQQFLCNHLHGTAWTLRGKFTSYSISLLTGKIRSSH